MLQARQHNRFPVRGHVTKAGSITSPERGLTRSPWGRTKFPGPWTRPVMGVSFTYSSARRMDGSACFRKHRGAETSDVTQRKGYLSLITCSAYFTHGFDLCCASSTSCSRKKRHALVLKGLGPGGDASMCTNHCDAPCSVLTVQGGVPGSKEGTSDGPVPTSTRSTGNVTLGCLEGHLGFVMKWRGAEGPGVSLCARRGGKTAWGAGRLRGQAAETQDPGAAPASQGTQMTVEAQLKAETGHLGKADLQQENIPQGGRRVPGGMAAERAAEATLLLIACDICISSRETLPSLPKNRDFTHSWEGARKPEGDGALAFGKDTS